MIHLRPYQQAIITETRQHLLSGKRSVLLVSPTGSGKTALTAHMIASAVAKGKRAWFTCHRSELVRQSVQALESDANLNVGVIAAGFGANGYHPAQVASIQTLMRRWQKYPLPDLLVVDEAQHQCSRSWSELLLALLTAKPSMKVIGLTATPTRLDGRGLGEWFEVMVQGPSTAALIADKYLSRYKLFAPSHADLSSVHTVAGDYNRKELDEAMSSSKVTGDAVKEYRARCMGKRALMFLWSVKSSEEMAARFNDEGIPSAHIDGTTPDDVRAARVRDFRDGRVLVLTNCELVTEGFDLPAIEACFLLRPTQSLGLYLQMVGRALRPFPGKEYALLMDHANLAMTHGLPDDEREWSLEGLAGKKRKPIITVRQCMRCYAVVPGYATFCRECRTPFDSQPRDVKVEAGELEEIDMEAMRRLLNVRRRREQGAAQSLEELQEIARAKGYKRGWAAHVWAARQDKLSKQADQYRPNGRERV